MPKKEEASKKHFQTPVELFQSAVCVGDMKRVKELFAVTGLYDAAIDEKGATGLISAAMFGQLEVASFLLPKLSQAQIAASDYMGNTAVMFAAQHGYIEIVMQLLLYLDSKEIVQTNRYNESALLWAARMGHSNLIQLFLKKLNILQISENGIIALIDAIWNGYADIVKLLIEAGITEAQIFTPHKSGTSPLFYAIRRENKDVIRMLLSKISSVEKIDETIVKNHFLKSIEVGSITAFKFFLPHMSQSELCAERTGEFVDRNEFLMAAVNHDRVEMVQRLLKEGVPAGNEHEHPCCGYHEYELKTSPALMQAIKRGNEEIVKLLLSHLTLEHIGDRKQGFGEDCCKEYWRGSALMVAAKGGNTEIVRLLLNAGLTQEHILYQKYKGMTALDVAVTDEIKQMIQNRIDELSAGGAT